MTARGSSKLLSLELGIEAPCQIRTHFNAGRRALNWWFFLYVSRINSPATSLLICTRAIEQEPVQTRKSDNNSWKNSRSHINNNYPSLIELRGIIHCRKNPRTSLNLTRVAEFPLSGKNNQIITRFLLHSLQADYDIKLIYSFFCL